MTVPTLTLRIIGRDLPGRTCAGHRDVHVALQVGPDPVGAVPGDAPEAVFTTEVRMTRAPSGEPDFTGPAVHGRRGGRFLYLTWGESADGRFAMFRRAKLLLGDLPPEARAAAEATGAALEARLSLTAPDGTPWCASVRPPAVVWEVAQPR
ncbi:DUF5990 family protein [Peterkaempfera sp. SMS 1(5)a]|uniref:DUF5990 family protein n=1 Tax=Peterkaempfera podocarpi TaxID=3232308 RepID=UPI00366CED16